MSQAEKDPQATPNPRPTGAATLAPLIDPPKRRIQFGVWRALLLVTLIGAITFACMMSGHFLPFIIGVGVSIVAIATTVSYLPPRWAAVSFLAALVSIPIAFIVASTYSMRFKQAMNRFRDYNIAPEPSDAIVWVVVMLFICLMFAIALGWAVSVARHDR